MRTACAVVLSLLLLPAAARAADPVIVAAGDIACSPADGSFNSGLGTMSPAPGRCHQKYTSDLFAGLDPTWVLVPGDIQYEDGRLEKFQASYHPSWGRAKAITKPVPGNHEYGSSGSNYDAQASGYFTYFHDQLAPHGPAATDPQRGWYAFDLPGWHIVALNSECAAGLRVQVGWDGDCAAGSEQERWLRQDLAANTSDCTLAFWHHPRFSSGGIGDQPIMAPIFDALYDDYADVVLTGHDHDYERFAPQDAAGAPAPGRGPREWVVGTGGKDLLPIPTDGPQPNSEALDNTTFGVLKMTLHPPSPGHPSGWYEWEFVGDGRSGSFTDTGSADCVASPATPDPPAAPPATKATVRPRLRGSARARPARVARSGEFRLSGKAVDCRGDGPACTVLTGASAHLPAAAARRVALGRLAYRVRSGRRGAVKGKLTKGGLRRLRRSGRIRARVRIRVARGETAARKTYRVTLRPPLRRR